MVSTAPPKYQSYAITIRPLDGATYRHDDILVKFAKKYCDYYYIVSEKLDSERHLHSGLFFTKAITRSSLSLMLKRIYRDFSDDEKRVLNQGIRIMYNFDFISNYLDKDDDTELIQQNLPEVHHLEAFWPPAKDQEKAKAAKAVDKYYANLEYLWYQRRDPGTPVAYESCASFLADMMYSARLIRVIRDDKQIAQTAKHLSRYLSKNTSFIPELAPWDSKL